MACLKSHLGNNRPITETVIEEDGIQEESHCGNRGSRLRIISIQLTPLMIWQPNMKPGLMEKENLSLI
jgi:hypothetical protein